MRRAIAILMGVALLASADGVLAHGGRSVGHAGGGGFHGGGTSIGFHGGGRGQRTPRGPFRDPPRGAFLGGCPRVLRGPPPFLPRPAFLPGAGLIRAPLFFAHSFYS